MKKETITFSMNHTQEQVTCVAGGEQRISSLDIAAVTGKEHKNVYGLDGEKKQRGYLVWTPVGVEMIRVMV